MLLKVDHANRPDPFLDKLRQQIIEIALADSGLDSDGLISHLTRLGLSDAAMGFLVGRHWATRLSRGAARRLFKHAQD